jgi:hypothetical protein
MLLTYMRQTFTVFQMDRRRTGVSSLVMTLKFQYHACGCVCVLVVTMRFCHCDLNVHFSGRYDSYVGCATNRQVAGSIPDGVIGIFQRRNPSSRTMALGSTQPLTEMSTRCISWG